jgi:two-component system chemotaxis response regulator CheB
MTRGQRKIRERAIPRKRRPAGAPFGRAPLGVPGGDLTDFGCPDCRGVLAVREEGTKGHLSFMCRVGHAFSAESLMKSKEEQVEDTLWTAVEVYEEIALLHREMSAHARAQGLQPLARAYELREKRAGTAMSDLRALIARDGPATADRVKG